MRESNPIDENEKGRKFSLWIDNLMDDNVCSIYLMSKITDDLEEHKKNKDILIIENEDGTYGIYYVIKESGNYNRNDPIIIDDKELVPEFSKLLCQDEKLIQWVKELVESRGGYTRSEFESQNTGMKQWFIETDIYLYIFPFMIFSLSWLMFFTLVVTSGSLAALGGAIPALLAIIICGAVCWLKYYFSNRVSLDSDFGNIAGLEHAFKAGEIIYNQLTDDEKQQLEAILGKLECCNICLEILNESSSAVAEFNSNQFKAAPDNKPSPKATAHIGCYEEWVKRGQKPIIHSSALESNNYFKYNLLFKFKRDTDGNAQLVNHSIFKQRGASEVSEKNIDLALDPRDDDAVVVGTDMHV